LNIEKNVAKIRERINLAAKKGGRDPNDVRLIAVTKTVGIEEFRELLACGVRDVGENRLQVALPKLTALAEEELSWHFIGTLQSNKAKKVTANFSCIHSVDNWELILEIDRTARSAEKKIQVLLEVNVSGEASKHGLGPETVPDLVRRCRELKNVELVGLMTMAPLTDDQEKVRPYFRSLRKLADRSALKECSMGMSDDFEVAVEEGSTMVRIGRALFR
jgi:hypothetical protein